jgi:hypothetical protein
MTAVFQKPALKTFMVREIYRQISQGVRPFRSLVANIEIYSKVMIEPQNRHFLRS